MSPLSTGSLSAVLISSADLPEAPSISIARPSFTPRGDSSTFSVLSRVRTCKATTPLSDRETPVQHFREIPSNLEQFCIEIIVAIRTWHVLGRVWTFRARPLHAHRDYWKQIANSCFNVGSKTPRESDRRPSRPSLYNLVTWVGFSEEFEAIHWTDLTSFGKPAPFIYYRC